MSTYLVSKKKEEEERTRLFHVPYFKSQQNTSCSGQEGQITSLERVTEGGLGVERNEVENRSRRF